ncbi:12389_t:CDS:2 [Acaulospora colombiana]|uniref:12389_t:CDS:1 n=1 Tax=Acaulospora colombiana TaxID=27376 RepID=A0ACA9KZZ4_9GLOM|nr:12389_t:CDS:2 [Acaulospora colombiana]
MRELKHFPVKVDFPVYCAGFNPAGDVLLGGGGGSQNSGVKNKLALYKLDIAKDTFERIVEIELNKNEDAPTCMTFHNEDNIVACGINSSAEDIEAGKNRNCRIFRYSNDKIELTNMVQTITSTSTEDYQKVIAFSRDNKLLATGGTDSKLTILKYPLLEAAFPPVNFDRQEVYDLDFNPTGDQIAVASPKVLQILSTKDGVYSKMECHHMGKKYDEDRLEKTNHHVRNEV